MPKNSFVLEIKYAATHRLDFANNFLPKWKTSIEYNLFLHLTDLPQLNVRFWSNENKQWPIATMAKVDGNVRPLHLDDGLATLLGVSRRNISLWSI